MGIFPVDLERFMCRDFFKEFRLYKDPLLAEYLETIFEGAVKYYHKQVDFACTFLTDNNTIPKDCVGISNYQGLFSRDVDFTSYVMGKYYAMRTAQGNEEVDKLRLLKNKITRDATFIQHWLRSLINIPNPSVQDLRNIFPDEVANACKKLSVLSRTVEFFIPEDKEKVYKKAQKTLIYYLGMRLLV